MGRFDARFLLLAAVGLVLGFVRGEWVEIPQFSDQQRIYRPAVKLTGQQEYEEQESDRRVYEIEEGAGGGLDRFGQKINYHKEVSLRNVSKLSGNRRPSFPDGEPSFGGTIATYTTERVISSIVEKNEGHAETETDEGVEVESYEEEPNVAQFDEPPIVDDSNDDITTASTTTESMDTTSEPTSTGTSKGSQSANETDNDKGFLDYLPIDLLKRVHKTLKSQPPTLKGKIRFLKVFERTLLTEIESRLSAALAPVRTPRGASWEHDEHDDGIGFPSLEGALMAISFLTFAVYLVRLVMLLFRNANNGVAPPIFIGRKRRSVDDYTEETARILSYLDSASPRQY